MTHSQPTAHTPDTIALNCEQAVGHADHWSCFTQAIAEDVPKWLQAHIDHAVMPTPLINGNSPRTHADTPASILLSGNQPIHLNQIIALDSQGKPTRFINAYPCVNSPYGQWATIESIYQCPEQLEAILRLKTDDGTILYVFDQYYALNQPNYQRDTRYYVNLSAFAYEVRLSNRAEVIVVDQPEAIRYHRAFNDILANNNNIPPADLEAQIAKWQPKAEDLPLQPIEINVGHMCAYLFGDTIGQQDEAWCQGQVLGKQPATFNGIEFMLLDVAILRESLDNPVVIRLAVNQNAISPTIAVGDYIQANIWLQGTIFAENQQVAS